MIWPARNFVLAIVAPTLLSLALLVPGFSELKTALIVIDCAIVLVALIDFCTLIGSSRLSAQRQCGSVASLGEPHHVSLTIENLGRLARVLAIKDDLPETFIADPAEFLATVPARGVITLEYQAIPERRGSYILRRVYALSSSRFRFWRRSIRMPVESVVRVYPDVRQIARYTLLARRDRLSALGVRRSRRLGTDNEFERLRDYAVGDEPRHLDWRATARRRKLTVRAHQINQSQRVVFLIDSGRMMAGDVGRGLSPLDHAFNAMLLLAHVALIRGDQVGMLVYADRIRAYVSPGGGPKRINRLVHGVHDIFPELVESRHDRAFVELERRSRKRSLVVVMTNVFDEVNAQQVTDHLGNLVGRHLPLGVFLRDRDLFQLADSPDGSHRALFRAAGAAAVLNWRERVLETVRRRGALTLDVFPEELTAPLVNRYLEIKARHLL
jgi:uncharacterized protein (DUF58 family)